MSSLLSPRSLLLLANFAWFGAGFYQFTLRARPTFIKGIARGPGEKSVSHADHGADIFRYLGAMGGSLALSTSPKLIASYKGDIETDLSYLYWLWGMAHASQALNSIFVVLPSGRWKSGGLGLGFITVVDVALWTVDWAVSYSSRIA